MGLLDDAEQTVYLDGHVIIEKIFIENKKEKDMKPDDSNKSLSARIKRRNAQGFIGIGNYHGVGPNHSYGDYTNQKQNHKEADYKRELARKNKLGVGGGRYRLYGYGRVMSKKFADNSQKL